MAPTNLHRDHKYGQQQWNWPNSVSDVTSLTKELVVDYVITPTCSQIREDRRQYSYSKKLLFWKSRTALLIYYDVAIAGLVLYYNVGIAIWILRVALLVLLAQITWIITKWILYTLDDPELDYAIQYIKTWLKRFVSEGENILTGDDAARFIVSYSFLKTFPTGLSYFRWIVRYKMRQCNLNYIETVVSERHDLPANLIEGLKRRREVLRGRLAGDGQSNEDTHSENSSSKLQPLHVPRRKQTTTLDGNPENSEN